MSAEKATVDKAFEAVARTLLTTFEANVGQARSWDNHIYLVISADVKGWVDLNPYIPDLGSSFRRLGTFAIAVAAQAAGRKVFVRYTGYNPSWGGGAGHFDSVELALQPF